ncbi:MAG TPA: PAS domain S-box protein [Marmoricola sp.]|nr:PAS domain S-box protein [Marmoricola sp.]
MQQLYADGPWELDALATIFARSREAQVLTDPDGIAVLGNAAAGDLLGLPVAQLAGVEVTRFARASMKGFVSQSIRTVALNDVELTVRNARVTQIDGVWHALDLTLQPMSTERGPMVAIGLREAADRYGQTQLFRGLLEAAPDAMVIVDDSGCIVLVNAQVEHLFGYARSELVGQPVELLVPDRFSGGHLAYRAGYSREPRTRPMGGQGDLYARRKDGTEFPVEISLAPLETDQGLLVSAAVRDISERKRLQQENDRVKDEFFATVSHELRTPLTSLIGYGELMADLEDLTDQGRRFLTVMLRSAERELRLVDDLLTLVAIEDSGLAIRNARVDVGPVVRDSVEAARPRAEEIDIALSVRLPQEQLLVDGDSDRLGQAVDNLLSNALKFTPAGGSVHVDVVELEGHVEIEVHDSGGGIGDQDPERVFERLYRAGSAVAQQVPGAGLGLTIARAIVEAHGGTIRIVKSDREGTTFALRLPRATPERVHAPAEEPAAGRGVRA